MHAPRPTALSLLLAQINTKILDLADTLRKIQDACAIARDEGLDLVVTPELVIPGYPPLDLLERADVLQRCVDTIPRLAEASRGTALLCGVALPADHGLPRDASGTHHDTGTSGHAPSSLDAATHVPAVNAAALFVDGVHVATVHKRLLPSYDVFDEDRYFDPGDAPGLVELRGVQLGVTICEDIWSDAEHGVSRYDIDPVAELASLGAQVIVNLSASPVHLGKTATRLALAAGVAADHGLPLAYCNLVGGNDQLLFDGRSFAVDEAGQLLATGRAFAEDLVRVTLPLRGHAEVPLPERSLARWPDMSAADEARAALVMGVRDYVTKCGFSKVIIGLSGGIDSAVTAAIAVDALGAGNVLGVAMPGPYSSQGSVDDALALAGNLGVRCVTIGIGPAYEGFLAMLGDELGPRADGAVTITEQNLQARARGTVLMALSNETGALVLTTGNKSELAVGYCTLYGDMNGGLAVIGDLPKLLVYDVARAFNRGPDGAFVERIPVATIDKPPSAELAPDQRDDDSLPPYPVLDAILQLHVVERASVDAIVAAGHDEAVVRRVVQLVERNEYKRRQAAPVLRVTAKAFGPGRRIPIARSL